MKIKSIYPAGNSSQLREVLGKYSPGEPSPMHPFMFLSQ